MTKQEAIQALLEIVEQLPERDLFQDAAIQAAREVLEHPDQGPGRDANAGQPHMLCVREQATGDSVQSPAELARSCADIARADQEVMLLIGYSTRNQEIFREIIFKGGQSMCNVDPVTILRHCLKRDADQFALVHNHPSDSADPSIQDRAITKKVKAAADAVGLRLMDHVIVAENNYTSFADKGWL